MDKIRIPELTFEQFEKALSGELIELIPAKEGYNIYLYLDGKYYKYIKSGMMKLKEIFTYDLSWNTIRELRKWFKPNSKYDCVISIGTEASINTKDGIIIHCSSAGWMPERHLDTKIIAKVSIIRMSLN